VVRNQPVPPFSSNGPVGLVTGTPYRGARTSRTSSQGGTDSKTYRYVPVGTETPRRIITRAYGESMTGVPATADMHFRNGTALAAVSPLPAPP
jgi:hypothetical protein